MAASPINRLDAADLGETIAAELARAAYQLRQQGKISAADALIQQARQNRIAALRLRAEASAERYRTMMPAPR